MTSDNVDTHRKGFSRWVFKKGWKARKRSDDSDVPMPHGCLLHFDSVVAVGNFNLK